MALSLSRKLLEPLSAGKSLSCWESRSTGKLASGLRALPVVEAELELERPQGLALAAGAAQLSVKGATGRGAAALGAWALVDTAAAEAPEERRRP